MKKRILLMLLVASMVMCIFTGCGNSAETSGNGNTGSLFAEEITITEMLNSIIEDEGRVVVYSATTDYGTPIEELEKPPYGIDIVVYEDGTRGWTNDYIQDKSLGEALALNVDETFDINYNNAWQGFKFFLYVPEGDDVVDVQKSADHTFGKFRRIEIDGKSYMLFETYLYGRNGECDNVKNVIIADTEYTKDKIVVFDSVEAENVTVKEESCTNMNGSAIFTSKEPE